MMSYRVWTKLGQVVKIAGIEGALTRLCTFNDARVDDRSVYVVSAVPPRSKVVQSSFGRRQKSHSLSHEAFERKKRTAVGHNRIPGTKRETVELHHDVLLLHAITAHRTPYTTYNSPAKKTAAVRYRQSSRRSRNHEKVPPPRTYRGARGERGGGWRRAGAGRTNLLLVLVVDY